MHTTTRPEVPAGRDELVDALLSASRAMVGLAARSLADLDAEVTLPQYRALVVLASRGPQRMVDISTELQVNPSTGTRMCDRLVRKGLARRYRTTGDRRAVRLTLTPAGRRLVEEVTTCRRTDLTRIVADMADHQRAPAIAGLVDPAPRRGRHPRHPDRDGEVPVAGLRFGQPDRADLRVGERHPRQRPVVRRRPVLTEDVADRNAGLVHRHVGERAVAGDISDRPQPLAGAHPLVDRDRLRRGVETDGIDAERGQVGAPAGGTGPTPDSSDSGPGARGQLGPRSSQGERESHHCVASAQPRYPTVTSTI
jgi:DNA-binding MarR family transcriptional regulator